MLRVSIHAGESRKRTLNNQLAVLDIAYAKREAVADYLLAYSARGCGEQAPELLTGYPRWSASLWDLVARALTRVLYHADQAPALVTPDRRCAYATELSAAITLQSAHGSGIELATADVVHQEGHRGHYIATFTEDILGAKVGRLVYGKKAMDPADLLLRAICWTFYGKDQLGPSPSLILPPSMKVEGVEMFHLEALREPARTGYLRHIGRDKPLAKPAAMQPAAEYVDFLMRR
jgi:hypothetical protein